MNPVNNINSKTIGREVNSNVFFYAPFFQPT